MSYFGSGSRSVNKTCRWHVFSGDLGGYADEGEPKQKLNEKENLRPKSEVFGCGRRI